MSAHGNNFTPSQPIVDLYMATFLMHNVQTANMYIYIYINNDIYGMCIYPGTKLEDSSLPPLRYIQVPETPQLSGMREMKKADVPRVHFLVSTYLKLLDVNELGVAECEEYWLGWSSRKW